MMQAHSWGSWSSGAFSPRLAPLAQDDTHSELCSLVRGRLWLLKLQAAGGTLWDRQHLPNAWDNDNMPSSHLIPHPMHLFYSQPLQNQLQPSMRCTTPLSEPLAPLYTPMEGQDETGEAAWPLDFQLSLHKLSCRCFPWVALVCQGFTTRNSQKMGLFQLCRDG